MKKSSCPFIQVKKRTKNHAHTHKSVTSNLFLPFYWGRKTHHNTKQQKKGSKAHPHPHVLCGRFIPANSQRFRLAGKGVSAYCVHAGCRYLQPSKRKCGEINHITGPSQPSLGWQSGKRQGPRCLENTSQTSNRMWVGPVSTRGYRQAPQGRGGGLWHKRAFG